jgi:hypothetical protein
MKSLSIIGVAVSTIFTLVLFCAPIQAEIIFNGDLEVDTSYVTTSQDPSTDTTLYDMGGRIKIAPSVRKEADKLFMEAKTDVLCKLDGTVAIDDAWGKIGTSAYDVQVGRFEGWGLFDKGVDIIIVDAPGGPGRYEANYARGRTGGPGQLALHVSPTDVFGFEAGIVYGNEGDDNVIGLRPVVSVTAGPVQFAAGVDMLNATPKDSDADNETSKLGYGAKVKATFGIATFGINYASGTVDGKDATGADLDEETTNSMGGYCDLGIGKGTFSLGAFYTTWEQKDNDYGKEQMQYHASYSHPLPIDGAAIKFGISHANATQESATGDIDSDAMGFKVRLNYAF